MLGQVSDLLALHAMQVDAPLQRSQFAGNAFEQRRFAGAVGTDDGQQAAGGNLSVQVVNRRMAIVAQGQIVEAQDRQARRRLLQFGIGSAALPFLGWPALAAPVARPGIGFRPVAASSEDAVRVPEGYTLQVLYAWGDPISAGPAFRGDAGNSAAEQAEQAGMHHDGMHFFPFISKGQASSTHGLLCVNHEYTDEALLHPEGMTDWNAAKTLKSQNAHGVSLIEIELRGSGRDWRWQVVRPSSYARRITARTPMRIDGPAAGAGPLCTGDDPAGQVVLGTLANCAMGVTPWGSYLTCEENFNGYFKGLPTPTAAQKRYGIREQVAGYRWHEHDRRFDVASEPNEVNRFGWVVEIDPWNPAAVPVKHTALGRFKHEGAMVTLAGDGRGGGIHGRR
jgi:secreted PhoX family phosphatase